MNKGISKSMMTFLIILIIVATVCDKYQQHKEEQRFEMEMQETYERLVQEYAMSDEELNVRELGWDMYVDVVKARMDLNEKKQDENFVTSTVTVG